MLRIGDYIFSLDIIEKKFQCDLPVCLGNCCRYGDAGAPLSEGEVKILSDEIETIKPYMRAEGLKSVAENGVFVKDIEGETVTPLIDGAECAYTVYDGAVLKCAIEKAWEDGKTGFKKPLSCHLFPVRMKTYHDFTALNYHEWPICQAARNKGKKEGVSVYAFLKEPLIRAIGKETYKELCIAAKELNKKR
jgi:hypothetical protein